MNNFEVLTAQNIAKILKVSRATAYEIIERDDSLSFVSVEISASWPMNI